MQTVSAETDNEIAAADNYYANRLQRPHRPPAMIGVTGCVYVSIILRVDIYLHVHIVSMPEHSHPGRDGPCAEAYVVEFAIDE